MIAAAAQSRVFDTPDELARHAAEWVVECARQSGPRFAICLSGGATPQRLYELLAAPAYRLRMPWERTHWFWGDERFVPHDDPQSNYRMAREALLRHVPVPADNVHPIPTEGLSVEQCAADYEAVLKRFYGADVFDAGRPLFDVVLLGLGEDGHIASLFPQSPALAETRRWVVPAVGAGAVERITLTYPALQSSRRTAFIVAGARKRAVLAKVRGGADASLPAVRLRPAGAVEWFVDRAAASAAAFARE